jgi:LPXTG-motif cell wall-anchored protein
LKSDTNGYFNIRGLDDGTYTLIETAAPNGYNVVAPITIVLKADTLYIQNWDGVAADAFNADAYADDKALTITVGTNAEEKGNITTGVVSTYVENFKGIVLPTTGGTGVKVLYTFGAILVLGASVLLITRRRMSVMK